MLRFSVETFLMDPSSLMLEDIWWETVILMCSAVRWRIGWAVTEGVLLGPPDGSGMG